MRGYNARMPTIRRILKYMSAVMLGLLVVAWIGSWFLVAGVHCGWIGFQIYQSSAVLEWGSEPYAPWWEFRQQTIEYPSEVLGRMTAQWNVRVSEWQGRTFATFPRIHMAILLLLTLCIPIAIGSFLSFRFRLWHYLAYTALVAVELAYYLRWQE